MTDYEKLYRESENFKTFVDKAAKADGETVEQELTKAVIRNVGDFYIERGDLKTVTTTKITGGCC